MARIRCRCGNSIYTPIQTVPYEYRLIKAEDIENILGLIDKGQNLSADQVHDMLLKDSILTYRCEVCGRLHLKNLSREAFFDSYVCES